ncbi:MAG: PepSY domain-containing protein [Anaerolineae bacterium]|nr:PepSY domain-containing protein [Anaerolineae bacterium]
MARKFILLLLSLILTGGLPLLAARTDRLSNPAVSINPADGIDLQEATAIALGQYPGAQVVLAELTRRGPRQSGPQAWDVKLNNGLAVYVDAASGAILELEPWSQAREVRGGRGRDERGGPPPWAGFPGGRRAWEAQQGRAPAQGVPAQSSPATTAITLEQATAIALAQYPGAQVVLAELTRRGPRQSGPQAWDVKLNNGLAVYVDAASGAILELEAWR